VPRRRLAHGRQGAWLPLLIPYCLLVLEI
jgi:hypothetical protein